MGSLLYNAADSDVTFSVGGELIRAHRAILTARSEYFSTMLASRFQEGGPGVQIEVKDTSAASFRCLLEFLYTDNIVFDDSLVIEVIRLADRYGVQLLHDKCVSYVLRNVQANNCIEFLLQAHG